MSIFFLRSVVGRGQLGGEGGGSEGSTCADGSRWK